MKFRNSKSLTLLALGMVVFAMKSSAQVHTLSERSHIDGAGVAFTPTGKVRIDLREVQAEAEGPKGPTPLSILVMHDPNSGAYSWRVHAADPTSPSLRLQQFNDSQAVFLHDDEFTDFMVLPTPLRLFVHQYSGHVPNMDEAVAKSLTEVNASINPLGDVEAIQGIHSVSLLAVGREFTNDPTSAAVIDVMPRVSRVQWEDKRWIVILKARWTEEIVLDTDFKVTSMRKLGN